MVKKTKKRARKSPDFQPTKMALAVAAAASSCLVLFAVIAMYM